MHLFYDYSSFKSSNSHELLLDLLIDCLLLRLELLLEEDVVLLDPDDLQNIIYLLFQIQPPLLQLRLPLLQILFQQIVLHLEPQAMVVGIDRVVELVELRGDQDNRLHLPEQLITYQWEVELYLLDVVPYEHRLVEVRVGHQKQCVGGLRDDPPQLFGRAQVGHSDELLHVEFLMVGLVHHELLADVIEI